MRILSMMIIGLLFSLSSSYVLVTISIVSNNAVVTGPELLEQIIIAAILGIVIGLLSLIFELERLLFTIQLALHFLAVTLCVFIAGYFGRWFEHSGMFYVFVSEVIIYSIVWCILYVLQINDIEKINQELQKRKQ
ncbi:type III secretory pathway component EscS [Lysinibacillus parviboronicapiens]|uniref:Type III secretory pathway component EscS n=1 Tax=Lysinibacillus parviboronicapiens TaxID=436516 RepID=A0ABV2PJD5_9BACI